jgi:hypothetical protein
LLVKNLDTFKAAVTVAIVLSLAAIGFIGVVAIDAIQGSKIPEQQYGTVASKSPLTDNPLANYKVTLANGKILYIQNNATLYDTLQINQSYLFDCRIDFNNQMTLIDKATQPDRGTA